MRTLAAVPIEVVPEIEPGPSAWCASQGKRVSLLGCAGCPHCLGLQVARVSHRCEVICDSSTAGDPAGDDAGR